MTRLTRDIWLARRRGGIGASDAAAVCGLCPYRTALEVYLEKTGQRTEHKESPAMAWGLKLEPAIAEAYEEQTGRLLEIAESFQRHPEYEWMLCNPDRTTVDGTRNVQLKTASVYVSDHWGEPGTDQVPENYLIQVQHEMACTGQDVTDIAVLIGGSDFRIYTVERDHTLIERLILIEEAFWGRVQSGNPPDPSYTHSTTADLLELLHPLDETREVDLDAEAAEIAARYRWATETEREADAIKQECKARLLAELAGAARGNLPDGSTVIRKKITRKGYEVKESSYVQFSIKAPRKL